MKRAVLLIGVHQAGGLTRLQAVGDGVKAMQQWAEVQNIETVEVMTDESAKVSVADIFAAINKMIDDGPPDQLIVYFAGHGINKVYSEYWLLSDAPNTPFEAVNVTASAELARRCGIGHVVFISDACRTTPESIGAQAVTGAPIFPNVTGARPGSVDLFFASRVGEPAFEIADESTAAGRFTSAFTDVVTRSLNGMYTELLEDQPDSPGKMVLRPWPLNRALPDLLLDELERLGVDLTINQQPDALISSDPSQAWLSVVPAKRSLLLKPPIPTPLGTAEKLAQVLASAAQLDTPNMSTVAVAAGDDDRLAPIVEQASALAATDWSMGTLVAPGVVVVGTTVLSCQVGESATFIEVVGDRCTNVATIEGYTACLFFDGLDLLSIHWATDRSVQTHPSDDEAIHAETRAILAVASRAGLLRFDPAQAQAVRQRVPRQSFDPAFDTYLAYASRPPVTEPSNPFDVAMLAEDGSIGIDGNADTARWPGFPLLSRGFGYLQALGADDQSAADVATTLAGHVVPSHWSLFDLGAKDVLLGLVGETSHE